MATFTVTNLNDSGAGSLRAAILAADASAPGVSNTINFSVAGTITLASNLPSITNLTAIVAGSVTTGSAPTVGIDFNHTGGLVFASGSDGSQLVGLSIGNAAGNGVTLNAGHIVLNNNYIGLALNGTALGNAGDGVFVAAGSSNNQIGSNPTAASNVISNVISANGGNGISFHGSANNIVVSNHVGTSVDGTVAMANAGNGIWLTAGSSGNTIGGTAYTNTTTGQQNDPTGSKGTATAVFVTPTLGNLVSGNAQDGILIDANSQNNVLNGNFVGTTASGNAALGNQGDGVAISGASNNSLIGCTLINIATPFVYYNVISGNGGNGLHITNSNSVTVQANFFGASANNSFSVANRADGILIDGSSQNTQVGGVIPLGNVVSGNGQNGIEVAGTANGFSSVNSFVGILAFAGVVPNANDGILITSTGGNNTLQTNVVSGNLANGVEIAGNASGVSVVPNIIGLNTRGDAIIANGNDGVLITGAAHDNSIGGVAAASVLSVIRQNTVSGNSHYGIEITGQAFNNTVKDSAVGTNIQETAALPNGAGGILLAGTGSNNVVGSAIVPGTPAPSPAALLNIISGNNGNGVTLASGVNGDAVINNWIGLNIAGQPVLPNTGLPIQNNGGSNLVFGNVPTGSLPVQSPTGQLEALYIGWFGRAADAPGFQYWMSNELTQILAGTPISTAALNTSQSFATSTENAIYAPLASLTTPISNPTAAQNALAASFIDQTYVNLFSRHVDAGGLLYWQNVFFSGQVGYSALVYDIAQGAQGADSTAENNKILAGSYFTTATANIGSVITPGGAAVSGVVDTTTELTSLAATNATVGSTHTQITYSSILAAGDIVTGVRGELNGQVVLTGSEPTGVGAATQAILYVGPLGNTSAGSKFAMTPVVSGETVTSATFYGPVTSIFDPSLGSGNVLAVGSYQYSQSPKGTFNHGMIYQGPVNGIGGTWTQTDVPSNGVNVVGGTAVGPVADTISHSTMGNLVVGNYDLVGQSLALSANAYIYNMATQQWTLMNVNGSLHNLTTLYGIWQNGVGSTSYTLAGGSNNGAGINQGILEDYDSATGTFSHLTFYSANNVPGVVTHFEGITAVPGGFNLVATTDSGPAFASVTVNADGSFSTASWTAANLSGSTLMTGNSVYQNTIMGIYSTANASNPATYTGVVDQSHVDQSGGLIMPVGSGNFAYSTTVVGSVGDFITGSATTGNVLGGSIGNDVITGTLSLSRADTIYTGGGSDTIVLAAAHTASDRIELYAGNSTSNVVSVAPGGVQTSVLGSIVDARDVPQLGWWGQATAQFGGPISNGTTNAGFGSGTSQDISSVVNFVAGSSINPIDSIDVSLGAFSNLLRTDGAGTVPALGTAVFSNLVSAGGTVTVATANVLLINSATGFANAAAVAAALATPATAITFAASQSSLLNHYLVAYQDLTGSVRIADMDIHGGSSAFSTTAQGQTISVSDVVQLIGVSLASFNAGNLHFVA